MTSRCSLNFRKRRTLAVVLAITFQIVWFHLQSSLSTTDAFLQSSSSTQKRDEIRFSNCFQSSSFLYATRYDRCDVAILGGGFGGLYTALTMDRMQKDRNLLPGKSTAPLDIALIDPSDDFVFLPLLYDLTMGTASTREVCPSYKELLEGTRIRHIKASLQGFCRTASKDGMAVQLSDASSCHDDLIVLSFEKAVVLAVGATPQSSLEQVPGASKYTQPFYTQNNAMETRDILFRLDQKIRRGHTPHVAVVGGGYGGVELAACLARRLTQANVSLLTRGPPMKGTRAEHLVDQALKTLGVTIELCSVDKIVPLNDERQIKYRGPVRVHRSDLHDNPVDTSNEEPWDVVFWTAGSSSADPVPNGVTELSIAMTSGRLALDEKLQCQWNATNLPPGMLSVSLPPVFALGDCAEILPPPQPAVPKTAQAAIQQADTVAYNVLAKLQGKPLRSFQFQDLGTVLSLGGPNGAVLGPNDGSSQLGPLLIPLLDTARVGLNVADNVFAKILNAPTTDPKSKQVVENLGLSLGGYGLGVDDGPKGTISGTLSGITRRAIYSLRMPTNRQRAYAAASSFVSSVSALAKEASQEYQRADIPPPNHDEENLSSQ
jgi:demethylphylloquinone reductase